MNYIDQLKVKGIIYSLKDASVAALVNAKIQELIGTAPENLNTLQELAAALLNNDDALEGIITTLASKTSKEYVDNLFNTIQLTPGPKGDTGEKGDKGDTGATGPQGPKGDTGETGAKGDQGIQGPKGDTGADGKSAYEIYKSTVNEQEAQPAIYAFESWNNSSKDIKYGEGQAKVVELRAGGATIEVISNTSTDPNAEDFVGRQFNIPTALATDEPIQLHTLENEPVNIWVTVTLIQEAQDAVVAMTQAEWLASLNGTVDTTNFYTKAEVDSNIRSNIGDLGLMIVNDSYDIRMNLTNPPIDNIILGKALLTGNLHSEIGDNNVETTYAELWVVEGTLGNEQMGGTQTIVPEMELKLYVPYPIVENEPLKAYKLVNSLEGDGEVVSDLGADAILSNFTAEHTRNRNVFEFTKEVFNQLSTSTNSLISDIRNTMNALLNNKANKTEIVKSYNDLKDRPFNDWNDTAEDAELVTVIALHDLHKKYEFLKSEIERLHNIVYTD